VTVITFRTANNHQVFADETDDTLKKIAHSAGLFLIFVGSAATSATVTAADIADGTPAQAVSTGSELAAASEPAQPAVTGTPIAETPVDSSADPTTPAVGAPRARTSLGAARADTDSSGEPAAQTNRAPRSAASTRGSSRPAA
jgi:hypothetical protein